MEKETLKKINQFTRKDLTESEVYTFSVKLCDNDIDRDNERFSDNALEQLAEKFIGKTGIFDHNPSSANQTSRIYDTEVISEPEKLTKDGRHYKYLRADAYMLRTDENKNLIAEIDGGIKKEVSISCSASKRICSVCGSENCSHQKGKDCHIILDGITDAYEWSFVAVPAQVNAGVTKKYRNEVADCENPSSELESARAEIERLTAENHAYKLKEIRLKTAIEYSIPPELADRISGDNESQIKEDAEKLAKFVKSKPTPNFKGEPQTNTIESAFMEMLNEIKK